MIRKTKRVSVKELYDLGIASKEGIIDYRKYSAFKLRYRMKGYDVRLRKVRVYRRGHETRSYKQSEI